MIQQAKLWARYGLTNERFAVLLASRYNALMEQSISDGGLNRVTAATKNAVSMAMDAPLSVPDIMQAMSYALEWIKAGRIPVTSRALGRFA